MIFHPASLGETNKKIIIINVYVVLFLIFF